MEHKKRGDLIFLDADNKKESAVNKYISCRDGFVKLCEYQSESGYGVPTRLFFCYDAKNEDVSIVRQSFSSYQNEWIEEVMNFDYDSYVYLEGLINKEKESLGATLSIVRN